MNDTIEIYYDAIKGALSLVCGNKAFANLSELICNEAKCGDVITQKLTVIRSIEIVEAPVPVKTSVLWQLTTQIGCIISGSAIGILLMIGLATVIGWLRAGN